MIITQQIPLINSKQQMLTIIPKSNRQKTARTLCFYRIRAAKGKKGNKKAFYRSPAKIRFWLCCSSVAA